MAKVVGKTSKFRHIVANPVQPTECYGDVRVGQISSESFVIKANSKFFTVPWARKGCAVIIPLNRTGKVDDNIPAFEHDDSFNELAFHPFNDYLLATAGNDGVARIWTIPSDNGLTESISVPTATYTGHTKRLLGIDFHPLANDVMYTWCADHDFKFWNIEVGKEVFSLPKVHKGVITCASWNGNASLIATTCKDKFLRVFDPRSDALAAEGPDHQGTKGSKVVWTGKKDKLVTIGFTKSNEREIALYDPRNLGKRLHSLPIDSSPSTPLPIYDDDTNVIILAGKGDGSLRFYEIVDEPPFIYFGNEYKSNVPQSGIVKLPKTKVNVMKCEILRLLKLSTSTVIPIRVEVPRASYDVFQEDLFPPTFDGSPALGANDWFSGKNGTPNLMSLKP